MNLNKYCYRCTAPLYRDDIKTQVKSEAYNIVFNVRKEWDRLDICDECVDEIKITVDENHRETGLFKTEGVNDYELNECEWCSKEDLCYDLLSKQNEYAYICKYCYENDEWDKDMYYEIGEEPQCHFCDYIGLLIGELNHSGESLPYCEKCYNEYIKPGGLDE